MSAGEARERRKEDYIETAERAKAQWKKDTV